MADRLKGRRKLIDRVKGTGQKRCWSNDEIAYRGGMVKLLRPDGCQDANQRQHRRPHQTKPQHRPKMRRCYIDAWPNCHGEPDSRPNQKCPRHRRPNKPRQYFCIRQRRHQIIDNRPLNLAHKQRKAGIGKGVLHHAHNDQARRNEIRKRNTQHRWLNLAKRDGKNDEVEQRSDGRCPHGLQLHLKKAAYLFHI